MFGFLAEYTRKAHVPGYLAPTHGLVKVNAPLAGTLVDMRVEEGRRVFRGDALYVLSTERSSPEVREAQAAAIAHLRERRESLARELEQHAVLSRLAQQELARRASDMAAELTQLQAAIATQSERLASARSTLERYEVLARQQFISAAQLAQQREQMLE